MTAIPGATHTSRMLVDGTLAITVMVEPRHAQDAFRLLCVPGTAVAMAALKSDTGGHERPEADASGRKRTEADAPKGGERAKWAAIRCKDADFQRWLCNTFENEWNSVPGDYPEEIAAAVVRSVCAVGSRSDFDTDKRAGTRFDVLIRKAWQEHCGVAA